MKKAFTLLELVFVIVVVGIITVIAIPNSKSTHLEEAAIQLVSHIRYTQHLAMVDDKYDANNTKWYKERWSIRFNEDIGSNNKIAYTIFADFNTASTGSVNLIEVARDPQNTNRYLSGGISGPVAVQINHPSYQGNKKMNLGMSYGIDTIKFKTGCKNKSFTFDYLGRPINSRLNTYTTAYKINDLITDQCEIILFSKDNNISIYIEPETGYAHL